MPVKSASRTQDKSQKAIQGRWGKSISPPNVTSRSSQLKGSSVVYLGKSIAPPRGKAVQKKESSDSKTQVQLPGKVQQKMEKSFGSSFSDVKVYKNSAQAKEIGAQAFTQGNEVHFAQGKFDPTSQSGQELLGHELTHVEQQRSGKVSPTKQTKGVAINDDASLEKEADVKGAKAARGETVQSEAKVSQQKANNKQTIQGFGLWKKIKKGAKKIGSKIASGAKKLGAGVKNIGAKAISGIKKAGAWLKEKAEIISWLKSAGSFAKSLWDLIKAKKWTDAYKVSKEGKKPPGVLAKIGAVVGLITGPIEIGKAVINIVRGSKNKKLIKEGKTPTNEKEKKAKKNVDGIQNLRITMAAGSATDGVLSIISSIMTLAGAATAGVGAIVAVVIQAIQLIISGAKMIYNQYRKRSKDYKAKIAAENEDTAEGMISLKDAKLYQAIGMKYDESTDQASEDKKEKAKDWKDSIRIKMSDIGKSIKGEEKEKVEVDKTQQKSKIIDHLNKEREEAATA